MLTAAKVDVFQSRFSQVLTQVLYCNVAFLSGIACAELLYVLWNVQKWYKYCMWAGSETLCNHA